METDWAHDDRPISQSSKVLSRALDEDLVVYHPATDHVTHLDAIAHVVWQHLHGSPTFADLVDSLVAKFEAERSVVQRDVAALLDGLNEKQLIERAIEPPTNQ